MNTYGNSSPFAACTVMRRTASLSSFFCNSSWSLWSAAFSMSASTPSSALSSSYCVASDTSSWRFSSRSRSSSVPFFFKSVSIPVRLMMNRRVEEIRSVRAVSAISCSICSKRSTFSRVAPLSSDRFPSKSFKSVTFPIPRDGSFMTRERSAILSRLSAKRR